MDVDQFWKDELLKANKDRLFGCAYGPLDISRSGDYHAKISGLISNHAYSVLRAVEVKDKRFVVVRNPWGGKLSASIEPIALLLTSPFTASEWTGPWSDGAKEWTAEWLAVLPLLGHSFGDDGEFVMECKPCILLFIASPTNDGTLQTRTFWTAGTKLIEPFCLILHGPFPLNGCMYNHAHCLVRGLMAMFPVSFLRRILQGTFTDDYTSHSYHLPSQSIARHDSLVPT